MYWIVGEGKGLEIGRKIIAPNSKNTQWNEFLASLGHNLRTSISNFISTNHYDYRYCSFFWMDI